MKQKIDFALGGQAVLEGVMMRSPNHYVVSVRDEKGRIHRMTKPFRSISEKYGFLNIPFLRGVVHLIESMSIGYKALDYSQSIAIAEPEMEADKEKSAAKSKFANFIVAISGILVIFASLALAIFLLKFLPLLAAETLAKHVPYIENNWMAFNAVDGVMKLIIFVGYILFISTFKDIKRVFQYHGAEHKSIWTYELGLPLEVKYAKQQSRFHPRCGTSFIVFAVMIGIAVYSLIPPAEGIPMMLVQRVLLLPLVAGVSYEFLKFSAKFKNSLVMRLLSKPGLLVQRLTTKEPDEDQLEVALDALKSSLLLERLSAEDAEEVEADEAFGEPVPEPIA